MPSPPARPARPPGPRPGRPVRGAQGLRERKKRRTRQRLAEAAWVLAHQRLGGDVRDGGGGRPGGWESVTVEEIAAAADVSRSTFFRYFASKEAVLFTWRDALFDAFRDELARTAPGESGFAAVRRALLRVGALYQRDRADIVRRQRVIDASPALVGYEYAVDRAWEDAIADALQARGARSAAARRNARLRAGAILGVLRVTLRHWIAGGGRGDLVQSGLYALDLLDPDVQPIADRASARRRTR